MVERKLLISDLKLEYDGLFDSADFLKMIDTWFERHGYSKNELRHVERVAEKGKYVDIEIMPYREADDYTKYEIYVRMNIVNLVEKKIKRKEQEFAINKGKVSVKIDVFLATDIRNLMESRPLYFFARTIFNKFLHRDYIGRRERELMNDVKGFHSELKAYLNLQRYQEQA